MIYIWYMHLLYYRRTKYRQYPCSIIIAFAFNATLRNTKSMVGADHRSCPSSGCCHGESQQGLAAWPCFFRSLPHGIRAESTKILKAYEKKWLEYMNGKLLDQMKQITSEINLHSSFFCVLDLIDSKLQCLKLVSPCRVLDCFWQEFLEQLMFGSQWNRRIFVSIWGSRGDC